jgi:hypothetical protein
VNPKISGRKNSFRVFVSNIENDNKYIDSDEYISSNCRVEYNEACWIRMGKKKHKHPMRISYADVLLGVDGGIGTKSLIKNQSPSLCCKKVPLRNTKKFEETNNELFYNLFLRKLKCDPEKKDLCAICEMINESD